MQLERLLAGWPVSLEDLDDDAYVLVATSLPDGQVCADAVSSEGLDALGLPATYPVDEHGALIGRDVCQPVGKAVKHAGLAGVWCISAGSRDGSGRELAWFPEPAGARARSLWREPLPLGAWRYVSSWSELGLPEQEAPVPVDPLPPQLP